jgi:hypothetical protein
MTESSNTERLPESGSNSATEDGKDLSLVPTHQLTPIAGSNGYQQQIGIDPNQPLDLSVTNVNGSVKVRTSEEQTVWVVVRRNDKDQDAPLNLTVAVDGNKISIHPDWQLSSSLAGLAKKIKDHLKHGLEPSEWNLHRLRFGTDFDFDIRVEVPRNLAEGSKVALRTTSGAIDVEGLTANVSAASASGSISARELDGEISLHTASGSVRAENTRNSLEANTASGSIKVNGGEAWTALRTVSGSINVADFTMRNAKLASVSGSMKLSVIANNALAPYSFDTVSGSINLTSILPAGNPGPSLSFRSVSGSAHADGEWASTGKRTFAVGDGQGARFKVNSVSGSLRATAQTDAAVAPRNEPLPNSDRYNGDQPTEPVNVPHVDVNFDREDINKAVNWAREAARRFTQPLEDQPTAPVASTPPTPPQPATPATPATPPAAATPVTPPAAQAANGTLGDEAAPAAAPVQAEPAVTEPQTAATSEPAAQSERPEDEEALKVLEALERGDIDVEEALARIERAENPTP